MLAMTTIGREIREEFLRCCADPTRVYYRRGFNMGGLMRFLIDRDQRVTFATIDVMPEADGSWFRRNFDIILQVEQTNNNQFELRTNGRHVFQFRGPNLPYAIPVCSSAWVEHSIVGRPLETLKITGCFLSDELRRTIQHDRISCDIAEVSAPAHYQNGLCFFDHEIERGTKVPTPAMLLSMDTTIDWTADQLFGTCYSPDLCELARSKSGCLGAFARQNRLMSKRVARWLA